MCMSFFLEIRILLLVLELEWHDNVREDGDALFRLQLQNDSQFIRYFHVKNQI